jgi:predicted nuclease of restriction endonuclease-like (RecB) superfamily
MLEKSYIKFLDDLKIQIKQSRIKAHLAVNRELILLYYNIGLAILEKQKEEGWGTKIIERVAKDLKQEFSEMTGLSYTNIQYMQRFAKSCCEIYPQAAGKLEELPFFNIPWGHNREVIDSLSEGSQRLWYANQTIKNGWSRNVLMHQIKSDLYRRQTSIEKTHNFDLTLPNPQSELVADLLKDEYNFEFLRGSNFKERELEDHLINNITKFLLELGKGFAFIGKQYHIEVGGQDFYIDLLFYNIELSCFVVIELKTGEFKPEYAGKLGFYLSIIDEKMRKKHDQNTIGIILCTKNNKEISKHSVRFMTKPIGVSEYKIAEKITDKKIKEILPSADEIEGIKI